MNTTTTPKSRQPQTRTAHVQQLGRTTVLWLTVGADITSYKLTALASDFGVAYRLLRADKGDGQGSAEYDVCLLDGGRSTCECLGSLRWRHRTTCKHVAALFQLRKQGKI
jgi:hypothetical protein